MPTYFDLQWIEIDIFAAVLACKTSNEDRFVREAMTHDDIDISPRAQYSAIQMIKKTQRTKAMDSVR